MENLVLDLASHLSSKQEYKPALGPALLCLAERGSSGTWLLGLSYRPAWFGQHGHDEKGKIYYSFLSTSLTTTVFNAVCLFLFVRGKPSVG